MTLPWRTQKEAKTFIQALLDQDDDTVGKALVVVYRNQTSGEKAVKGVSYANGMGFTPADARFGSILAEFYKERGFLSEKQLAWARPRMKKYWNQMRMNAEDRHGQSCGEALASDPTPHHHTPHYG